MCNQFLWFRFVLKRLLVKCLPRRCAYKNPLYHNERFFSWTLESNSSDDTGLTLHAQTYIQKNETLVKSSSSQKGRFEDNTSIITFKIPALKSRQTY